MPRFKDLYVPSDGALSFSIRNHDHPWWWYLDLNGTPLYFISNNCETCTTIFKRVQDLQVPIAPQELSERFAEGVQVISDDIIRTVTPLLPKGEYIVGLVKILPIRGPQYPRDPRTDWACESDYFWWRLFRKGWKYTPYEVILPFVPEANLNADRIAWYRARLKTGHKPTALALSMVNDRFPQGKHHVRALAHYLLDGHHKIMAASQINYPITLLSFLRETDLFTGTRSIDAKVRAHYEAESGNPLDEL